jgi:dUTP pyrophosphatase
MPFHQVLVKRINKDAPIPTLAKVGDVGFDLTTNEGFTLKAGESVLVPTGLAFKIPQGYYGQIKPRSGWALKGLTVDGGVIDRGFTGEVKVILYNRNKSDELHIKAGDRIAQILFLQVLTTPLIEEIDELPQTERGNDGFGSTGKGKFQTALQELIRRREGAFYRRSGLACVEEYDEEKKEEAEKEEKEENADWAREL